jgi:hypothetical protein
MSTTADSAAAFHAARPFYTAQHVAEIATHCEAKGIPFCDECKDWHNVGDLHSI